MQENKRNPTFGERVTAFNTKLAGSNGGMILFVVILVVIGGAALIPKEKPPVTATISRDTSEELKSKNLINNEYEDNFLATCKDYTMPKVNNDAKKMSRICGCEYESIANIALGNNKPFADVVSEMTNGQRSIESCEFVD